MTIGERIKQKRLELNLSQDELAKKVGYKSRSSIQKIECARKLPLDKVEVMADALGCSAPYLMGWLDDLSPEDKELLERYHNATPADQAKVAATLKFRQHKI